MKHPLYIEIIGLPGSGKTKAGELLVECLGDIGVEGKLRLPIDAGFLSRVNIFLQSLILFLFTPALWQLWLHSPKGEYSKVPGATKVARSVRRRLVLEAIIAKKLLRGNQVLINDEGLIGKTIVPSLIQIIDESLVVKILDKILPKQTLIIYLNTSPDISINRVKDRNTPLPFYDGMTDEIKDKFYKHNSDVYESVCQQLFKVRNTKTVRINNSSDTKQLKSELNKLVQALV